MIIGSCHCGNVRIAVPRAPEWVASCNCRICRRTGALLAYFAPDEVRVDGDTMTYLTGDRFIRFHFCGRCHCHTHWSANPEALAGDLPEEVRAILGDRMGINARLLDGFAVTKDGPTFDGAAIDVRFFDNAG
jgi:hypothetical protein